MVIGSDPRDHKDRLSQDESYANYFDDHRGGSKAVAMGCEVIFSAIRDGRIKTTEETRSGNHTLTTSTYIRKSDWINWCRDNGYSPLASRFSPKQEFKSVLESDECRPTTTQTAHQADDPEADDTGKGIHKERGCRFLIRSNWEEIKTKHGLQANGRQVHLFLKDKIDVSDHRHTLKTFQNCLTELRKEGLLS